MVAGGSSWPLPFYIAATGSNQLASEDGTQAVYQHARSAAVVRVNRHPLR